MRLAYLLKNVCIWWTNVITRMQLERLEEELLDVSAKLSHTKWK